MEDIIIRTEKDVINIQIPKGIITSKEIKNLFSEYYLVKKILKKSKAKQKHIDLLAKEINKNLTANLKKSKGW